MPVSRTPSWTNPGGYISRGASASRQPFDIRTMFSQNPNPQRPYNAPVYSPQRPTGMFAGPSNMGPGPQMRAPITSQSPSNRVPSTQNLGPIPPQVPNEPPDESGLMDDLLSQIRGNQSSLRSGHSDLLAQLQGNLNRPEEVYTDYTPEDQVYSSSPENKRAMLMLEELAKNGGYSEADQNNIRARGVAPIRSVYAQAQEGLNRNAALQGGYSPNKTAASAKMTRELADRVAGQTTNINADLAEKIATGKMNMAPQFAQFAGRENELINAILGKNIGARNEASQFNKGMQSKVFAGNRDNRNDIMGQIQALFGTNANMTNDFTNQIMSHAEMGQRNRQNRFQNRRVM